MRLIELAPSPELSPYVQLLWVLELDSPFDFGPPAKIAPDGIVELVFHYRDPMKVRFAGEAFARQPTSSLILQTRRFVEIYPSGGSTGLIAVRFRPWGAHAFLTMPLSELSDQMVAAEDVWGGVVRDLEEQLVKAGDTRRRAALVEQFLLCRLRPPQQAVVEPLVRAAWKGKGHARVVQLCEQLGMTERTLQRIFAAALGMPPRSFLRLTRFLSACSLLRHGRWNTLTQVAQECGYFDQAHFIGDFKALAGMTPREFLTSPGLSFLEAG